jgi:hypothetical protein
MKIRLAIVNPEARWGQPLFVDGRGRPVYLGRGADGTDDEGEGDTDSGGEGDADGDGDGEGEGEKAKKDAGAEADAEALRNKIRLADKRAAAAEAKLKDLEDKDKSALEVAERKLAEAQATNDKLLAQVRTQALENAFLATNDITWHDPDDALTAAQRAGLLEGVQDEDGAVDKTKLKSALQKLAKAKPHYVKSSKDGDAAGAGSGAGPTGTTTGSGRKAGTKDGPTEEQLRQRYAALRR